jgi:hypothetical protein
VPFQSPWGVIKPSSLSESQSLELREARVEAHFLMLEYAQLLNAPSQILRHPAF